MRIPGYRVLLALATGAVALAAVACGSDTKSAGSDSNASQASVDQLAARVQRNEQLDAWVTISNMPMHALDTSMQSGTIDNKYVPTLRTMVRLLALTDWTSDVKDEATKLHDDGVTLMQELDAGKTAAEVKGRSTTVHEDWHMFGPAVGDMLAKDLPADAGGPQPEHDDASSGAATTPAASQGIATPAMAH
jgi:hypothetical protein